MSSSVSWLLARTCPLHVFRLRSRACPTLCDFRSFALRVLALAVAFEAFIAIDSRFFASIVFVLAFLAFLPGSFLFGVE
jgi:hypothetical protein